MNLFNGNRSYIQESDTKITIINNKINIINYKDIISFDSNIVIIKLDKKNIIIKGEDLVVSKLMNDEVLITGVFKNIEFR